MKISRLRTYLARHELASVNAQIFPTWMIALRTDVWPFRTRRRPSAAAGRSSLLTLVGPSDQATHSQARSEAKITAREATPREVRSVVEGLRPDTGPKPGSGQTANRTNELADKTAKGLGILGKVATVGAGVGAALDIVSSNNKSAAIARNAGAISGGILGGEIGSAMGYYSFTAAGYYFGGPVIGRAAGGIGGPLGGVVGSTIGGYLGGKLGQSADEQNVKRP